MPTLEGTLHGTTALVTGGSRGIGRAICLRLAAEGANIILHYHRNRAAAEEVAAMIGRPVIFAQADMGSLAEIENMFRELCDVRLNFLINNAGIWKGTPLGSTPAALLDELLDTNVKGPFWVTQCALPLLKDGARVVNLSSTAARIGVAGAFFSDPANLEHALGRHPLGRICAPEDVADVVAFLCSDAARFITGQSINVSGGSVI
jgi:NAD(P)-dependent dehydrogenase (short-subunit alcohol dehydrogenase family)